MTKILIAKSLRYYYMLYHWNLSIAIAYGLQLNTSSMLSSWNLQLPISNIWNLQLPIAIDWNLQLSIGIDWNQQLAVAIDWNLQLPIVIG